MVEGIFETNLDIARKARKSLKVGHRQGELKRALPVFREVINAYYYDGDGFYAAI